MARKTVRSACTNGDKLVETGLAHIADAAAITGGEVPTEAEYNALVTKLNAVIKRLEDCGISLTA